MFLIELYICIFDVPYLRCKTLRLHALVQSRCERNTSNLYFLFREWRKAIVKLSVHAHASKLRVADGWKTDILLVLESYVFLRKHRELEKRALLRVKILIVAAFTSIY